MANSAGHASCMGTTIGGYEVLSHIGRGAMGTVYLARDVKLNRHAALKVLLGSVARNPAAVKRFHLEAQAAAPIRHPNIVRIYSAGVDEGIPYIAMEYVEGEPLDRFLRRKGQLKWQNALYITQQVAEALDCAHRSGVVHRDIKPANIMLDRQGRVRLTDFGIANVQSGDGEIPEDTGTLATPQYMSPEQCCGQPLTSSCDLFALGVTLYHMLTGDFPFKGESAPALIKSITNDEPPRVNRIVPDIPDDVARLVAYLLEKRPENRPESGLAVSQLIQRIQEQSGGTSAMPAALTAFIKEQTQPRAVGGATQVAVSKKSSTIHKRLKKRRGANPVLRKTALAVAALVLLTALATGISYGLTTRGVKQPASAQPLEAIAFKRQFSKALVASLIGDAYAFETLSWVGDHPAVLVEVMGRPGTLMQGMRGAIAVEPDQLRAFNVIAPHSVGPDAERASVMPPRQASFAIFPVPKDSPLHDAVVVASFDSIGRHGEREAVSLVQRWNEAVPRPEVLYRAPIASQDALVGNWWGGDDEGCVAVSPNGTTLCLVREEPALGTAYLVERDVRAKPLDQVGARLTASARILPRSVRYSPDGSRLVYLRERAPGERELWVVASGGVEVNGKCLLVGPLGDTACFDPSGNRVAVNRDLPGQEEPGIIVVGCDNSQQSVDVGRGSIGPESWSPDGRFLFAVARPEAAPVAADANPAFALMPRQIFAIDTVPPHGRRLVADIPGGVRPPAAVSRDGRWVVGVAESAVPPSLIFVELEQTSIGRLAATRAM